MKNKYSIHTKEKLDGIVLDIEFLLISVVQGLALVTLADNAARLLSEFQFAFWIYIFSAFLFILIFWSQAIIHALSFIDWPINLTHSFLYFIVGFVEVLAFYHMNNPLMWFALTSLFFVTAFLLYGVDLLMIKQRKKNFESTHIKKQLYTHIVNRQLFELRILLPLGFLFNLSALILIVYFPSTFIDKQFHIFLAGLQTLFTIILLINSVINFRQRLTLITKTLVHS